MLLVVVPWTLHEAADADFSLIYVAGSLVLTGDFDAIYPLPIDGAEVNAGFVGGSREHPRFEARRVARGAPETNRFIYPPPVALIWSPLGGLTYPGARLVFATVSAVCAWIVGLWAAWVYRRLGGELAWMPGVLCGAVCGSVVLLQAMRAMNLSMVLGAALGWMVWSVLADRWAHAAGAGAVGGLAKGSSAPLLLVVAALGRFREWAGVAVLAAVVVGLSTAMMGWQPMATYFREVAPTLRHGSTLSHNQSLHAFVLRGPVPDAVAPWVQPLGLVMLLGWCGGVAMLRRRLRRDAAGLAAALLGAMLIWIVTSPLAWVHYQVMVMPLWGYLAWEAGRGRWRAGAVVLIGLGTWFPWNVVLPKLRGTPGVSLAEPWGSLTLWANCLTIGLCAARLVAAGRGKLQQDAAAGGSELCR